MKKARWYHILAQGILLLFLYSCSYTIGYELTKLVFMATGKPPELVAYILSGLVGVALIPLIRSVIPVFNRQAAQGRHRNSPQARLLADTLDAMSRIAQGDFNVLVTAKDERDPYSELASSVNKMARELGSMEKLRQDFISNVSHEIKSPLTSISGYASLLERDGVTQEQVALRHDHRYGKPPPVKTERKPAAAFHAGSGWRHAGNQAIPRGQAA